MRSILLFIFSVFFSSLNFCQPVFTKLIEKKYSELPIHLRIENSGIFAISSFDVENGNIWVQDFDSKIIYKVSGDRLQKDKNKILSLNNDFVKGNLSQELLPVKPHADNITLKKSFLFDKENIFTDEQGFLSNSLNDNIYIKVNNDELQVNYQIRDFTKTFEINNIPNLAYADLIGIDSNGNSFFIIESYISQRPLKVKREVYTISDQGKVLSVLEVPSIKYLYMVKDFQIDADGNLYQLLSDKEKVTVIKWSGLANYSANKISYPNEYNYELDYNTITPTKEAVEISPERYSVDNIQAVNRTSAVRTAETYTLCKYSCNSKNLAPTDTKGSDGDIVRTPDWLVVGENARIPYKWGGFNTVSQYLSGLSNGRYAGDINTAGVSSWAVGVDCSGFVSKCWGLSYHATTSAMPSITTQYSSWNDLRPGDAILKSGHVRLFVDKASNGALRVIEASARGWDVSYWTYTPSDLSAYTPRRYNGMADDYSFSQPLLNSALNQPDGKISLSWNCDTTNVKGYRLYESTDGSTWKVVLDENTLNSTTAELEMTGSSVYFRVTSVLNNSPSYSESNWSNVLGAGQINNSKRILIVDGFNRISGDWRGNGNPFVSQYGKALAQLNESFESVKNSEVLDSTVSLNDYDAVYWMLGDESTTDETLNSEEQKLISSYLENGGKLFISGSEIGWDLSYKGSSTDKDFYTNYLKASFISDGSGSDLVTGIEGTSLTGTNFYIAQTYQSNYPDVISNSGGSSICIKYSNNKGAGIEYTGKFGSSEKSAKLIYLGFPLETTANDTAFNLVISKSASYFFNDVSAVSESGNLQIDLI